MERPHSTLDLRGAALARRDLRRAVLARRDLVRADLTGALLDDADLRGARLHGARLRGARLAKVQAADLSARDADLERGCLTDAALRGADLTGAILLDADLRGADLRDANLTRADLRGADLRWTDLRGARLTGADLAYARLDHARVGEVRARRVRLRGATDGQTGVLDSLRSTTERVTHDRGPPLRERVPALTRRLKERAGHATAAVTAEGRARAEAIAERRRVISEDLDDWLSRRREAAAAREMEWREIAARQEEAFQESRRRAEQIRRATRAEAAARALLGGEPLLPANWRTDPAPPLPSPTRERLLLRRRATGRTAARRLEQAAGSRHRAALPERAPTFTPEDTPAPAPRRRRPELPDARNLVAERARAARGQLVRWRSERRAADLARLRERDRDRRIPGGPGAILTGADLRRRRLGAVPWAGADLRQAQLERSRLGGADLRAARLEEARLAGADLRGARMARADLSRAQAASARLRGADLRGAAARGATLVDADLRSTDLRDADLTRADLSGVDLRSANLDGADLTGANLTGARLTDLDLQRTVLDGALLDQADLAGATWTGASVVEADFRGALGLSGRDRAALEAAGARSGERGMEVLVGHLASREIRAAVAILGIGLTAWLAGRYISERSPSGESLETAAESRRHTDPLGASALYAELAAAAPTVDDRVGYLVEAAELARVGGEPAQATALLAEAREEAAGNPPVLARVHLQEAALRLALEEWEAALVALAPVLEMDGLPAATQAELVVAYEDALAGGAGGGADQAPLRVPLEAYLGDKLPEAAADLHLAVAETRSSRGETDAALAQLDAAGALELPPDLAMRVRESRARTLDRAGETDAAAALWRAMLDETEPGSLVGQAAALALADLRYRQGRSGDAAALLEGLLGVEPGDRVQARAQLLRGRLFEENGDLPAAMTTYQEASRVSGAEPDTTEEIRMAIARLLLVEGQDAEALLAGLPADEAQRIRVQARLGEIRTLLDAGDGAGALEIAETLGTPDDPVLAAAVRSSLAEGLSRVGRLPEAVALWRDLLGEVPPEERVWIEIQLANGLLQGGSREEAQTAFRSLATSADPDIATQGRLGLAQVAMAEGETARARTLLEEISTRAGDPAYRIQALRELADLSTQAGLSDDALEAWRSVLVLAPPGHPAAPEARLAVVMALAGRGDLAEADALCQQAVADSSDEPWAAQVTCAEVLERSDRTSAARSAWRALLDAREIPPDALADAALGVARCALTEDDPDAAISALTRGLEDVSAPALRLPLLAMQVQAWQAAGGGETHAGEEARAERDALIAKVPHLAGGILIDAAAGVRSRGQSEEAAGLLRQAVELPLATAERTGALVELGDVESELGRLEEARAWYTQALEPQALELQALELPDPALRFGAAMGLAEVQRRMGDAEAAATRLAALTPPDTGARLWWLEVRARLATELGDDDAALSLWEELSSEGADPETTAGALTGRAAVLLGADDPAGALELYGEAADVATQPGTRGWAQLGRAEALLALDRVEEALTALDALAGHDDPEISLQATLRGAGHHAGRERWSEALEALEGVDAARLGPGWDASLVEIRATALAGDGRPEDARAEWEARAARWPGEEEAELPAWRGSATLARASGDAEAARRWLEPALAASDPGYRDQAEALWATLEQ